MLNDGSSILSLDAWEARFHEIKERATLPDYLEIVELARTSPILAFAFSDTFRWRYDAQSAANQLTQDIVVAHGLKEWLRAAAYDSDFDGESVILSYVRRSSISSVHFDALQSACSQVMEKGGTLHPICHDWVVEFLANRVQRPKQKRGPDIYKNAERDHLIVSFLRQIAELDYPITEDEVTFECTSACHAIVEALQSFPNLPTAKTLMNIWSKRSRR